MVNWPAMTTLIYLHGKTGKMGLAISREIQENTAYRLVDTFINCDVVIDFSSPAALPLLLKMGKPLVIGTTGFNEAEKMSIQEAAKLLPIFVTPNFSVGMTLLRQLASELADKVGSEASIEIVEAHHELKKDKPSGSALGLAEEMKRDVPIHSIRAGDIIGDHTVVVALKGERLELKHQVHSRSAFAAGALKAAAFLKTQPAGYYTMKDLVYASC